MAVDFCAFTSALVSGGSATSSPDWFLAGFVLKNKPMATVRSRLGVDTTNKARERGCARADCANMRNVTQAYLTRLERGRLEAYRYDRLEVACTCTARIPVLYTRLDPL